MLSFSSIYQKCYMQIHVFVDVTEHHKIWNNFWVRIAILLHQRAGDEKKMTTKYTKNPARRIPA